MIQDIGRGRFRNEYTLRAEAAPQDTAVVFRGRTILVVKEDGAEEERFRLPLISELEGAETARFQYLFRIDSTNYQMLLPENYAVPVQASAEENSSGEDSGSGDNNTLPAEEFSCRGGKYAELRSLRGSHPKETVYAAETAWQLYCWYRDNRFCGRCGGRMRIGDKERNLICDFCGNTAYPRIMPAVIVGVVSRTAGSAQAAGVPDVSGSAVPGTGTPDPAAPAKRTPLGSDRIMMTRYRGRGFTHHALIAGFCEIGETGEDTVRREVMEETGLAVKNIVYYSSQPWGFDSDLLLGYFCELDGEDTVTIDEEELSTAEWVRRDEISETFEDVSLTNDMMIAFKEGRDPFSAVI